jgi:ATP-dependent DNA helicase RecG
MPAIEKIKTLIAQREGLTLEFKKSHTALPRNVFETICAFMNRKGGHILLGVADDGSIEGIKEDTIQTQLKRLADDMNNPQIIMPIARLETEIVEIDGKKIISIYVPESPEPHSCLGVYYDRNEDGDYRLTTRRVITDLYIRKQDGYTEDKIFPAMRMDDFEVDLFDKVRKMLSVRSNGEHPWSDMGNEDILRSARMYLRDERTGKEGYTLAAALLFGKVNTIASVFPHYRIDALCRKEDVERYDDREVIDCNLIRAYDRLMAFVQKHTPDRFFLEGTVRISLRDVIFREMIANLLSHREYSSPYRATLTIYSDTVVTENWNIPYTMGRITPENLKPHSKNPTIAGFFRQLGWVEELGSGVRKMFHYCPLYAKDKNALPIMEEGDIFKLTVRYGKESAREKDNVSTQIKRVWH